MREALFWLILAVVLGGHLLLLHAAWRLRRAAAPLPPGVPQSDARADLLWTLATAALTLLMLWFAFQIL